MRNKAFGGDQADVGDRVVAQLSDLVENVRALRSRQIRVIRGTSRKQEAE